MKVRALVVEQSPVVAKQIAGALVAAGCQVVGICSDGVSAVKHARELQPDVVTVDLILPLMSGLQVATALRNDPHPPMIVAVSSVTARDRVAAAKEAGVRFYVLKPIDPAKLTDVGQRVVAEIVAKAA